MSSKLLEQALTKEGASLPLVQLAASIYAQESSSGANTKTSNAGAVGGMQILPATFNEVADKGWDINNPEHNARAGIRYLAKMLNRAGGDLRLAAVGYYGGPKGMDKAKKGVAVRDPLNPKAPDTLRYADQVVGRIGVQPPGGVVYARGEAPNQIPEVVAPPAAAVGQPSNGGGAPGPVALDPALFTQAAPKVPQALLERNEWEAFLTAMAAGKKPVAQSQGAQPVQVADLIYPKANVPIPGLPMGRVDFSAFRGWGPKA